MLSLRRTLLGLLCLVGFACDGLRPTIAAELGGRSDEQVTEDAIQLLIGQLGAQEFPARERAQSELANLKWIAFESLEEVRDHDDFEIRVRVRRLLDELRGPLMLESGAKGVNDLLQGYTDLDEEARSEKIQVLGEMEPTDALPVLTRFARFEESRDLAKQAALAAMRLEYPTDRSSRAAFARKIQELAGLSKRPAVRWLKTFADSLTDPGDQLEAWREINEEIVSLDLPDGVLRGILQVHMEVLVRSGEKEPALELARQILATEVKGRQDLAEISDWIIRRELFELFEPFYNKHQADFDADRSLLYRLAEVRLKNGMPDEADKIAERAFNVKPDARSLAKTDWIWGAFHSDGAVHATLGNDLRDRGLFSWAEREFRAGLKHKVSPYYVFTKSHTWLSEMLHDQQDDQRAAAVLKDLVTAVGKDAELRKGVKAMESALGSITARMHYFSACHHEREEKRKEQIAALEAAVQAAPNDADVLIAMYRLPNPPADWQRRTERLIEASASQTLEAIRRQRNKWEANNGNESTRGQLAQKLNDYAWLIGNTEGDVLQALRFSHESLQLQPATAGYLDTLGRCYYRLGEFENAIKYQKQAVRRDPKSGQLVRQLQLFEAALADQE